jgi:hypothetical protein
VAVTAEVQIMNSALIKIGAERIISPNDDNNRAKLCKEQYPKVRDALLRAHPWKFATGRAQLAALSPKPDYFWNFDYVFQLPASCLRVLETNLSIYDEWDVEGKYLACNSSSIQIKFIQKVIDVSYFDDNFCEVLAWALADDICFAITQNAAKGKDVRDSYEKALAPARSFNAQQGSVKRVVSDDWIDAQR